eukprot:365915-Chlamydomonas_euryale.AAC.2
MARAASASIGSTSRAPPPAPPTSPFSVRAAASSNDPPPPLLSPWPRDGGEAVAAAAAPAAAFAAEKPAAGAGGGAAAAAVACAARLWRNVAIASSVVEQDVVQRGGRLGSHAAARKRGVERAAQRSHGGHTVRHDGRRGRRGGRGDSGGSCCRSAKDMQPDSSPCAAAIAAAAAAAARHMRLDLHRRLRRPNVNHSSVEAGAATAVAVGASAGCRRPFKSDGERLIHLQPAVLCVRRGCWRAKWLLGRHSAVQRTKQGVWR